MKIQLNKNELKDAVRLTLEKNNMHSDTHIRLIVSRGIKSTPYQSPAVTISKPTIISD